MFDKQYSTALLNIGSPSKDTSKARSFNGTGSAMSQGPTSPQSSHSAANGASFKGLQVIKSGIEGGSIVSGRDDGLRVADSETGVTSPKIAIPANGIISSPVSQRDHSQFQALNSSMLPHQQSGVGKKNVPLQEEEDEFEFLL